MKNKFNFAALFPSIFIFGLIIGIGFGYWIKTYSLSKVETLNLNIESNEQTTNSITRSFMYQCNNCKLPIHQVSYDTKNNTAYIYTFYWKHNGSFIHDVYLDRTKILKLYSDGAMSILKE